MESAENECVSAGWKCNVCVCVFVYQPEISARFIWMEIAIRFASKIHGNISIQRIETVITVPWDTRASSTVAAKIFFASFDMKWKVILGEIAGKKKRDRNYLPVNHDVALTICADGNGCDYLHRF